MSVEQGHIKQARERIAQVAQQMLDGECSFIEGARTITAMLDDAQLERLEQPFVAFVAIDSETDTVPIGDLRERWHPESALKLIPQWDSAERYAASVGRAACIDTIAWIDAHSLDVS